MRVNLPNGITLLRLGCLPGVLWLMWPGRATPIGTFWAAAVYVVAGIGDVVDGALARRTGQVTQLGKFLDPLVDKVFYLVTLIALLQLPGPWVPAWVVMLHFVREFAITGLRGIAAAEGIVIAAGQGGKLKTSLATAGIVALILHYPYLIDLGFNAYVVDASLVGLWLTYLALILSWLSAFAYMAGFLRATGRARPPAAPSA